MRQHRGLVITALVVVVVIVIAVIVSRVLPRHDTTSVAVGASATPSSTQPQDGIPSGVPSGGEVGQDGTSSDSDESTYAPTTSCEDSLDAATYKAFKSRVETFEGNFLSAPSPARDEVLTGLTTKQYQLDHDSSAAKSETSHVTVRLLDKSLVTCTPDSGGSRQVTVLATIETSHKNDVGATVIIVPELTLATIYYSTWVEEGGVWRVNEEN